MTFVITALVENALLFRQLASVVEIDLLDTGPLTPFARVAVFSTLALIGAQAAFPIMLLKGNFISRHGRTAVSATWATDMAAASSAASRKTIRACEHQQAACRLRKSQSTPTGNAGEDRSLS